MPGTKEPASMNAIYTLVGEHDELIKQDILPMLVELKKSDEALQKADEDILREVQGIKTNFVTLENTIWKTAQSTQDHASAQSAQHSAQNAQQWKLIEDLIKGKQEDMRNKHEIRKTKLEKFWEWLGKVTVGGGIFIVALELLFGK